MIDISIGLGAAHRTKAAELYYTAFRQKLHPIFRDEVRGVAVLERALDGSHAIVATHDGQLVGLAGFKDAAGSMVDLQPPMMTEVFGFFGGWWRLLALSLFERKLEPGTLLMDGIVVDASMRGQGVGTKLLDAVIAYASDKGYVQVRLDVVDTNPRARQLYERKGFVEVRSESYPFLRRIFGFSGAATMVKQVP